MAKLARIISFVLHPVFIPLVGTYIVFNTGTMFSFIPGGIRNFVYLVVLMTTIVLPLSLMPFLRYKNLITSYTLDDRRERIIPMSLSIFSFFIGFFMFRNIMMTSFFETMFLAIMVIVGGVSLISMKWKISMHMTTIGAFTALLGVLTFKYAADIFYLDMLVVFLSGLLGFARLYRGGHNPSQIYTGYLWGFTSAFTILWYL